MSRRGRHGRHPHAHAAVRPSRPRGPSPERITPPAAIPAPVPVAEPLAARPVPVDPAPVDPAPVDPAPVDPAPARLAAPLPLMVPAPPAALVARPPRSAPFVPSVAMATGATDDGEREHLRPRATGPAGPAPTRPVVRPAADAAGDPGDTRPTCTVAQLRRFIKSRPWVPMHELRRRFGISGAEDDVTPIRVGDSRLYVGLPAAEGRLMGELLSGGDVGYELSMDPDVPIVVGVYPMRPVPRT